MCGGLTLRPLGSTSYCQEAGLVESTGLSHHHDFPCVRALGKRAVFQGQEQGEERLTH